MKKIFIFTAKAVILVLVLIISHIIITYSVEQLEFVTITPLTISDARESHIVNIFAPFPFIVIWGGWLYFLAFYVHHYIIRNKLANVAFWVQAGVGVTVVICFFLAWWVFIEPMDFEILREGLIVYPLLGVVLTLLHMLLFQD